MTSLFFNVYQYVFCWFCLKFFFWVRVCSKARLRCVASHFSQHVALLRDHPKAVVFQQSRTRTHIGHHQRQLNLTRKNKDNYSPVWFFFTAKANSSKGNCPQLSSLKWNNKQFTSEEGSPLRLNSFLVNISKSCILWCS